MAPGNSTNLGSAHDEESSCRAGTVSEVVDREIGRVASGDVAISICDVVASTERNASVARRGTTPATTSTRRWYVGVVRDARRTKKKERSGAGDGFVGRRGRWRMFWGRRLKLRRRVTRRKALSPTGQSSKPCGGPPGRVWRGRRHAGANRWRWRAPAIWQCAPW